MIKQNYLPYATGLLPICIVALLLPACSLLRITNQTQTINEAAVITGTVSLADDQEGPVSVLLYRNERRSSSLIDKYDLTEEGRFTFYAVPDDYFVFAYLDSNRDGKYQFDEPATYRTVEYRKTPRIDGQINGTRTITPLEIRTRLDLDDQNLATVDLTAAITNTGKIVSIDDPMFSDDNASLGLWRPIDFLSNVGGGLYLLEDYQPGKIPVVFVHGVNGHAGNFSELIEQMDTSKFQPLVMFYPGGVRLDMVSDYLVKAINTLQLRYGFDRFYLVAHSMGGLVARSFIKKYYANGHSAELKLFISIDTPFLGLESALAGVNHSPIIVPAWRDIAVNSEFVHNLNEWDLPDGIPFYLIFSFSPGRDGDGVVPMRSLLPAKLQEEATRMYGFNSTHSGVLKEESFIARFNRILADSLAE